MTDKPKPGPVVLNLRKESPTPEIVGMSLSRQRLYEEAVRANRTAIRQVFASPQKTPRREAMTD